MESQLLWFLLAGFILGFAASTLWEWLYFRGRRLAAIADPPQPAEPRDEVVPRYESARTSPAPPETSYRSPAVFLEGEQPRGESHSPSEPASYEPLQPAPVTAQTSTAPSEAQGSEPA